jgi:hypothetical protein
MLDLITYILTFVIIAFVLISAVIVHLHLSSHWRIVLKRRTVKSDGKASPTLHESIFQEQKVKKPDDGTSSTLHEGIFR